MSVQKIREYLVLHWQKVAGCGAALTVAAAALYWRLGTLVGGYSPAEQATYHASLNVHTLLDNPLNAPFLLVVKALHFIHPDSLLVTRIAATLFGIGTLVLFAIILHKWYDAKTAVASTLLFGLSAWFLHTARLGTPDVLMFGVFALAICGYWLKKTNHWLALVACFTLTAALLYVPGMIWFIILGLAWQWRVIDKIFKKRFIVVSAGTLGLFAALVPLGLALYKNHALIKPLLALPEAWPAPMEMVRNVFAVPFHLFIRNSTEPAVWLGQAPILDVFTLTMFILGCYLYFRHFRLARTPIFLSILLLTFGLMVIGSSIRYTVVIPFIYLVVAAGLSYLTDQWFKVFPKNPIARVTGWIMLGAIIVLACSYQLTHYFAGWPHATATREIYTVQKP